MTILRDSDGYIVNAAVLKASDLHQDHVRCPACAKFGFFRWPSGWNAHSGKCAGLSPGDDWQRQSEYHKKVGHLFFNG